MNETERNAAMDEWQSARAAVDELREELDDEAYDAGDDDDWLLEEVKHQLCETERRLHAIERRFPECRLPWPKRATCL